MVIETANTLLELHEVSAGYGEARVLHGVDLRVAHGESVLVIGRNGVGKSTLIETVVGLTSHHAGSILLDGLRVDRLPAHARNRRGIGWVPQEREVFRSLTVQENLQVVAQPGHWTLPRVLELFPRLGGRLGHLATQLSGGEQQMLAVARALMTNPQLLLLDEPVEGLAPVVAQHMMNALTHMRRSGSMGILLAEQKWDAVLSFCDRYIVIDHGAIVHAGRTADLSGDASLAARLMGIGI